MDICIKVLVLSAVVFTEVSTAPSRKARLTLASQPPNYFYRGNDGSYTFGYDVLDPETGNTQFRTEERYSNGTVVGSYGYIDALGTSRRYDYIADDKGYRVVSETLRQNPYSASLDNTIEDQSTEAPVIYTRPPKKKPLVVTPKPDSGRESNYLLPPSYYASY